MKPEFLGELWYEKLKGEFEKPYMVDLKARLREAYSNTVCFPEASECFTAFKLTPFDQVKVVILGQDPYPSDHAHGLAFSSKKRITPASLQIVFRELDRSIFHTNGYSEYRQHIKSNNLSCWAKQGVLLLNTILSVEEGRPGSHSTFGWQNFTSEAIRLLWEDPAPKVFVLWGVSAFDTFSNIVDENLAGKQHLVLQSGHPATAAHGKDLFSNNNHFVKINKFLEKNQRGTINWQVTE